MDIYNDEKDFSRAFFIFLKYNQISNQVSLSESDETLYKEFNNKVKALNEALSENNNGASFLLGSLMSMFGFNRHYCAISGRPIIGKYYKIGGKIVSKESYESYEIIQQLKKVEKQDN